MKTFIAVLFSIAILSPVFAADTHLVLFGGGAKPPIALKRFIQWAGGKEARILVITWATAVPNDTFSALKQELQPYGAAEVVEGVRRESLPAQREILAKQIQAATGIFFAGGDQNRIMDVLIADGAIYTLLRQRYAEGIVFSGTSAGTAIMSETMLSQEMDPGVIDPRKVALRRGLGLLPSNVFVDQHFIRRQRTNRMMSVLFGRGKGLYGVGVDEGAALAVTANKSLEPLVGQTMLFDSTSAPGAVVVRIIQPGTSTRVIGKQSKATFELQ